MSIQYTEYMALGFKPTTFGTRVSSHNHQTRAPASRPFGQDQSVVSVLISLIFLNYYTDIIVFYSQCIHLLQAREREDEQVVTIGLKFVNNLSQVGGLSREVPIWHHHHVISVVVRCAILHTYLPTYLWSFCRHSLLISLDIRRSS